MKACGDRVDCACCARIEELELERERLQSAVRVLVDFGESVKPQGKWREWSPEMNQTIREAFAAIEGGGEEE